MILNTNRKEKLTYALLFFLTISINSVTSAASKTPETKTPQTLNIANININIINANNQNKIHISWLKKTFSTLSWEEMLQVTKTPQDICSEVRANVKYRKDLIDIKKDPKQTWEDKYGDCEDFAFCILEICKIKNIEAKIYIFYEKGNQIQIAHAVVIGNNWMASNGQYRSITSLEDAS